MQWELNYREPAKEWIESLPLGNGEIGAMVSGGTRQETIELNLDTLWSGSQKQSEAYPDLPDWNHIRKLVFESRYNEAEEYAKSHILRDWTAAYLPVGTVDVQMMTENGNNEITEYKRELSLNDALHTVHWIEGGVTYQKETFVSMSDNVLVMKISTDSDSEVKVHVSLRSQMPCVWRKSENSDPVGKYAQDGSPCQYALWPMSSAWLCRHMWEHYCYTLDGDFLKDRAYPVIREAVRFYLGYLTEYDGYLVTCPSTSPENCFLDRKGEKHSVTFASTMDISILKELFATYLQICKILKVDVLEKETEFALKKLPPFKIGHDGQLQEWYRDYRETDIHHRHVSHLYGLYPGNVIKETDQELKKACEISLNRRGSQGTGWCMVWKASLWARLKNGEKAFELLKNQVNLTHTTEVDMSGGGIYPNLFCAHPPFQIDGNFGFAAAISEMLLQSQNNDIELLPAIPEQWKRGQIKGIKARGGYTVDFSWKNGKVYYIKISALKEGNVIVRYNGQISRFFFKKGQNKVCLQKTDRK